MSSTEEGFPLLRSGRIASYPLTPMARTKQCPQSHPAIDQIISQWQDARAYWPISSGRCHLFRVYSRAASLFASLFNVIHKAID